MVSVNDKAVKNKTQIHHSVAQWFWAEPTGLDHAQSSGSPKSSMVLSVRPGMRTVKTRSRQPESCLLYHMQNLFFFCLVYDNLKIIGSNFFVIYAIR